MYNRKYPSSKQSSNLSHHTFSTGRIEYYPKLRLDKHLDTQSSRWNVLDVLGLASVSFDTVSEGCFEYLVIYPSSMVF